MSVPSDQPAPPVPPVLPLLVGFDGSARSLAAARWAAREALATGAPLRLLHVGQAWPTVQPISVEFQPVLGEGERAARTVLTALAEELRATHQGLTVEAATAEGGPGNEIPRAAAQAHAGLIVLGASGEARHHVAPGLGSTALHVAGRAEVPVVLVREPAERAPHGHGVVVGVEPAGDHAAVLDFAYAWAARHDLPLRAVHAVQTDPADPQELEAAVAAAGARYPGVRTECVTRHGDPARLLLDESAEADLLVVGRRHHRPLHGMGPTDHAVAHHAHSPVALIPHG
ncbi:universal stress protein [Streptomyces sp. NBC_00335]|uniref:universal stress protein n=1 Tax=unclassified Streptomyces TaxID=2593676 RepID=UPI00225BEA3F|nr:MULTISPECIES: universal stress protein [unclassified Streptomyces]MCX5406135.1 universal stress protein [Streptomyces sp. NBC_00086]